MQAVLILAHKDKEQVFKLCEKLNGHFKIYINFDKKCLLTETDKSKLNNLNVKYLNDIDVKWGSWSIVEATINLINLAFNDKEVDYFHLISGQDWPVQEVSRIYNYFEKNKDKVYLEVQNIKGIKKSGEPIEFWQKYYFNYDKINRKSLFGKIYHRFSMIFQTLLRVDKLKKEGVDIELYTGSQWFDMPRRVLEDVLKYLENNRKVRKIFETGFCSDEFWLPTIIMDINKGYKVENKNNRFIKWEKQHDSYPAILDERDLDQIKNSKAMFARKFDLHHSKKLIKMLEENN